ncbi:hypothetical protein ABIA33_003838 [Streptacidiphilus sp. MAP12-16]|uniref:hypothetical protein n=1 Tax=Streptacidiphilus sp. MAP12-16 TaxID=3156300 RepID=UPI0035117F8F
MPRLTPAQICYGTLSVVVATVALLAASGAHSLLAVSLLVILGLTLGTIAAALAITAPARRGAAPGRSRLVAHGRPTASAPIVESIPERERARR